MQSVCGIDVSKDRLDIVVLPEQQCFSVRNDAAGWAELVERLRGLSISAIGLEASGGYERGAMRALLAAGMPARQVNPFKLRQFARASGVLAKNDPLDTRMIASFVAIMPTQPAQPRAPAIERLTEPSAQCRESCRRECFQIAGRCDAAAAFSPSDRKARSRYRHARPAFGRDCGSRCSARPSIPAAHFHAGSRTRVGLHADRCPSWAA